MLWSVILFPSSVGLAVGLWSLFTVLLKYMDPFGLGPTILGYAISAVVLAVASAAMYAGIHAASKIGDSNERGLWIGASMALLSFYVVLIQGVLLYDELINL